MAKKEAPARVARGKSWLVPVLISVIVAAVAGGGAAWFFVSRASAPAEGAESAEAEAEAPKPPAIYTSIDPAFVVNLADEEVRYLQVEIQVMSREPTVGDDLKTHMPMIRNRLLLLFSQQKSSELRTREDKERLQSAALQEVQAVLTEQTGKSAIEALLFTSFVTQ